MPKEISIQDLVDEFREKYEDKVVEMCMQFRFEHGPGALMVNFVNELETTTNDIDVEYWKLADLTPDLKQKILTNPNRDTTIYYVLNFHESSMIIEKDLRED